MYSKEEYSKLSTVEDKVDYLIKNFNFMDRTTTGNIPKEDMHEMNVLSVAEKTEENLKKLVMFLKNHGYSDYDIMLSLNGSKIVKNICGNNKEFMKKYVVKPTILDLPQNDPNPITIEVNTEDTKQEEPNAETEHQDASKKEEPKQDTPKQEKKKSEPVAKVEEVEEKLEQSPISQEEVEAARMMTANDIIGSINSTSNFAASDAQKQFNSVSVQNKIWSIQNRIAFVYDHYLNTNETAADNILSVINNQSFINQMNRYGVIPNNKYMEIPMGTFAYDTTMYQLCLYANTCMADLGVIILIGLAPSIVNGVLMAPFEIIPVHAMPINGQYVIRYDMLSKQQNNQQPVQSQAQQQPKQEQKQQTVNNQAQQQQPRSNNNKKNNRKK